MDQLSKLQIGNITVSTRGARTAQLQLEGSGKLSLNISDEAVSSPFGATCFGEESSRKTIEFTLPPGAQAFWKAFDQWAVGYLSEHSERLFKKVLTPQQVTETYKSPVHQRADYPPHLRCKISFAGPAACKFWNESGQRCPMLTELRGISMRPRVTISHAWFMQREIGFVLQLTDLMIVEQVDTCPFIM
jgi:hypothetical protein